MEPIKKLTNTTTITLNIFQDSTFPLSINCWDFSHYLYGNFFTMKFS